MSLWSLRKLTAQVREQPWLSGTQQHGLTADPYILNQRLYQGFGASGVF
jgi:hypothetical protein